MSNQTRYLFVCTRGQLPEEHEENPKTFFEALFGRKDLLIHFLGNSCYIIRIPDYQEPVNLADYDDHEFDIKVNTRANTKTCRHPENECDMGALGLCCYFDCKTECQITGCPPCQDEPAPTPAPAPAPATVVPATVAPATVAPATVAPATVAPATVAPATVAPATVDSEEIEEALRQFNDKEQFELEQMEFELQMDVHIFRAGSPQPEGKGYTATDEIARQQNVIREQQNEINSLKAALLSAQENLLNAHITLEHAHKMIAKQEGAIAFLKGEL